jgi:5-methylcytosine-specific restriction endonuclease McrA
MANDTYVCKICNYETSTKWCIISHLQKKKPCGLSKVYTRDQLLNELTARTYNDVTYNCTICHRKFNDPSNRNKHQRICETKHVNEAANTPSTLQTPTVTKVEINIEEFELMKKNILDMQSTIQHLLEERKHHIEDTSSFTTTQSQPSHKTKSKIPRTKRIACWNTYIGEEVGKALCICCKTIYITPFNFECGHVVAESQGGTSDITNLRPICRTCNNDMSAQNMIAFAKEHYKVDIEQCLSSSA